MAHLLAGDRRHIVDTTGGVGFRVTVGVAALDEAFGPRRRPVGTARRTPGIIEKFRAAAARIALLTLVDDSQSGVEINC